MMDRVVVASDEKRQSRDSAYLRRLIAVSVTLAFFLSALCTGGYMAGSLALMASPALMASELLGFSMSISALSSASND